MYKNGWKIKVVRECQSSCSFFAFVFYKIARYLLIIYDKRVSYPNVDIISVAFTMSQSLSYI